MLTNKQLNILSAGIVVGALAGAVAAYFFAPQDGAKTKKMVAKKANSFTQTSILRAQNLLINLETALEKDMVENDRY